ncbi:hypothetical protein ALUC_20311A [Aspergillus luchuensis]|nr:hypothetical protein ALUC_20311A [Aspergillus luchuensis]
MFGDGVDVQAVELTICIFHQHLENRSEPLSEVPVNSRLETDHYSRMSSTLLCLEALNFENPRVSKASVEHLCAKSAQDSVSRNQGDVELGFGRVFYLGGLCLL